MVLRPAFAYEDFYSRPCGRGDEASLREGKWISGKFLLTPLREGRLCFLPVAADDVKISTHAPAGGATRPSSWSA